MKNLELKKMENLSGGEMTACESALLLGGIGFALAVFAPWSYLMMGGVAVDAIGVAINCLD